MRKEKILIFIPAYNVEKKITGVFKKIPRYILKQYNINILIVEDNSKDNTLKVIKKNINKKIIKNTKINLIINKKNLGYGGVQKVAYNYAIRKKFDYVIMLHGDGQYAPEELPNLLNGLNRNKFDVVIGSRMIKKKNALKGGMPLYKLIGNIILTKIQNFLLNKNLAEFHSGYRIYSVKSLKSIPFHLNTNDFHFDTEILIQLFIINSKIKEISIPTFYGDEICHVNGMKYAFNIVKTTFIALLQNKFDLKFTKKYIRNHQIQKIYKNHIMEKLLVAAKKRN